MSIFRVISSCVTALVIYGCTGSRQQPATGGELYDKVYTYWKDIDVASLSEDSLEQHIVDFLFLVENLDRNEREDVWGGFYRTVREQPDRTVVDYLGEAESPLYSPALLEEYLTCLMKYTDDETVRCRTGYLLENILKNPYGAIISDLKIFTGNRATSSLHYLIGEGDGDCLIVFYDPDCEYCNVVLDRLEHIGSTDPRIIAISITEKTNVLSDFCVSALVADEDEFHDKFYYTSLPSIYLVSDTGIIKAGSK